MKKPRLIVKSFVAFAAIGVVVYVLSALWPVCLWGMRLSSPDGKYDLVVTLGDKAAFDDFFYTIHVFPRSVTPTDRKQGDRIWRLGVWRDDDYVVYSGYSFPGYRWTGPRSLEIDVKPESDGSASIWNFKPVLKTGVMVSLVFGGESGENRHPIEHAENRPNKAPVPTPASVTPAANAPVAPAAAAAQL